MARALLKGGFHVLSCTEAIVLAPSGLIENLVREGLATILPGTRRRRHIAWVAITDAGRRALALAG
jgi:hypothetical protein